MKGKQKFIFDEKTETYTVQLKKKNFWWLLLLLLPLLFLLLQIKINKEIIFKTVIQTNTDKTQIPISEATVNLTYPIRNFIDFKTLNFNTLEQQQQQKITEKDGLATFKVTYTIFQKIFGQKDNAQVIATGGCFQSDSLTPRYFSLFNKKINTLELEARKKTISITIIDSTDQQVLPDAEVTITTHTNGQTQTINTKSDTRGIAEFSALYCSDSLEINATKYGYEAKKITGTTNHFELASNRILSLEPIMTQIKFTVKNLYTKQPIPNSNAQLITKNNTQTITTNTNGIGKGMFDSIAITKEMHIKITHPAYHDTITQTYIAEKYAKLSEEKRTIYLRPKPGNFTFKNIDKLSSTPIEGVKNEVYINGTKKGEYFSNTNGEFTVPDLTTTDKISIISTHQSYFPNDYTIKNKKISQLTTKKSRTIPMKPDLTPQNVEPPKINCRAHFSGTLLSDFYIDNHISIIYKSDKYGEYVGQGEYPSNDQAFPKAVDHTFDAIAIDKNTRVIIYSKPNFKGQILLDATGPALINNVKWATDQKIKNVNTKTLSGNLQNLFPKSCRRWSSSDMNDWSHGSIKIICNQ